MGSTPAGTTIPNIFALTGKAVIDKRLVFGYSYRDPLFIQEV